jgi:hypothetical protein
LFQSLLSLALIAFAGLVVFVLLSSARLSQQTTEPLEASRDPAVTDRAEWKQFYDAVVGNERTAEIAQPADAAPEKRASGDAVDVVEVPAATGVPEPSASIPPTAATTLPVVPQSASGELAVKLDAPPPQAAAPPDPPREKTVNTAVSNEPSRDQVPQEAAPSVAASEKAPPPLATAPVAPLEAKSEKSPPSVTPPAARPVPTPRPKVAAPVTPAPSAARVKQATPAPEREPARSRPSVPPRARVALPRQRSAPQPDGSQWVDPQQQSGTLSYAPQQYNALPPGGPQFGPYFPYGSSPPPTQRSRAPQVAPRQYNDPYGWR